MVELADPHAGLAGSLERIRDAVWRMEHGDDWEEVAGRVFQELADLGVTFAFASMLFADLETDTMRGLGIRWGTEIVYPVTRRPLEGAIRRAIERGEVVYRPDLERGDPFGERDEGRTHGIRCLLDVPFRCGTVGLSHGSPAVFSHGQIETLRRIAAVLGEACQRAADLRSLAQRNVKLEQEIAQRRRMERELVRSQSLRSVAAVSAGVSHNLNNLLTGILGPAQLLERMTRDAEMLEQIRAIIRAASRARDLIFRLGQSVRGATDEELGPISLDEAVQAALWQVRHGGRGGEDGPESRMRIEVRIAEVPLIRVIPAQLDAVLTNLLSNAVDWYRRGADFADALHLAASKDVLMHTFDRDFCKAARGAGVAPAVRILET